MRRGLIKGAMVSLIAASAVAQPVAFAAPAASQLSLSGASRASTSAEGASDQLATPSIGVILGVVGVIAGAVVVVADENDEPDSD